MKCDKTNKKQKIKLSKCRPWAASAWSLFVFGIDALVRSRVCLPRLICSDSSGLLLSDRRGKEGVRERWCVFVCGWEGERGSVVTMEVGKDATKIYQQSYCQN